MTTGRPMRATDPTWRARFAQVAFLSLGLLLADLGHAETGEPSPVVSRCQNASRPVSNCKAGLTIRDPDGSSWADADGQETGDRDDLDGRARQIETMNQQLRMEKRRKDSLLHLYPDEAAHNAARGRDLAEKDRQIRVAEDRVDDLARERRRLDESIGFYAGKSVPADLRNQSQHIDAALAEARGALRNCRDERVQVSKTYDDELGVLRKLWAVQRGS